MSPVKEQWLEKPQSGDDLIRLLPNKMWRLHNLYTILNEYGQPVKFIPREPQLDFLQNRHGLDLILKARQLGFSTVIQIDMLDDALFNANMHCAIVAQTLHDCTEIFRSKIKFAYESLPGAIKEIVKAERDSTTHLEFSNGSIIRVGTSLRSSTVNSLHISEYGKICAKEPEKSREIRTGALNTVHAGQKIVIESTAEGREGHFFDMCQKAEQNALRDIALTGMDFKFHFYPWWQDRKYRMNPEGVIIIPMLDQYFSDLEQKEGVTLDLEQKAWYAKKWETQQEEMKREFPATPKEAFEQAIEGAYFADQMRRAREEGRITNIVYNSRYPVNTFWDIGHNDYTSIWFHQRIGTNDHFIDYYESSGEWMEHYARIIQEKGYVYGGHYLPHDSTNKYTNAPGSTMDVAYELLKGEVYKVPRIPQKQTAINIARSCFSSCLFNEKGCATGIKHLDNYRKEWNEHLGQWRETPHKDAATHGADAFMTFATGYGAVEDGDNYYDDEDDDYLYESRDSTGY